MNLIMNNYKYLVPDYGQESQLLYSDTTYYLYKSTRVLRKYYKPDTMNGFTGTREIKDAELGLTVRMHRWTCGCEVSLPNTIIYLSNRKDFDYAFVLNDESLKKNEEDTVHKGFLPNGPPPLQFQLNYLCNRLVLNFNSKKKEIHHFLSIITDSLLGLKKLSDEDAAQFNLDAKMTKELKDNNGDILYYESSSKYYKGFWRFEFITYQVNRIFIKAEFSRKP